MATVEEIVRDIQVSAPSGIGGLAIARWIDNRYKEMVSRVRFRNLRSTGELVLAGVINTGTVSATRGSTTITGVSTTFATDLGATAQEHYYLRVRSAWYKIASVAGETSLTLATAFAEDTISGASYTIVKRTHSLASTARWIGQFLHTRLHHSLGFPLTMDELDLLAPGRILATGLPQRVAQAGVDSSGYLKVEVYPPPTESEILHYTYWTLPTALTMSSTIPAQIDAYTLKEGALIDVYAKAKIMQIEKGNVEAASVYSNSEAKQRTIWKDALKSAQYTQRGADDATFMLASFGSSNGGIYDISTARDHILLNWSR